jgi:hypothetical protein
MRNCYVTRDAQETRRPFCRWRENTVKRQRVNCKSGVGGVGVRPAGKRNYAK